ncbi:MAG: uncharacterized protein QOK20_3482 [Acidimicrobiaceae bacterium]|jgi:uncharacterized protein (TIGR01777 family)|nr:uncharacterized protein [Acidimicrobiaceae bacterium]
MRIAVTGSHGLIGSALVSELERQGHDVVALVRGSAGPGRIAWDPEAGQLDAAHLAGVDAAVHLAGQPIADKRWTAEQKRKILDSRVASTDLLARRLAEAQPRPSVLVSGSAIGYYGDRGDAIVDESSPAGSGFLSEVCQRWEEATAPAEAAGIRVVHIRTGIVLSPEGGVLKKQLPLFRVGMGGRLGSGEQYQSWISLVDEVGGIIHALRTESLSGALNLTAPNPVTNGEFTKTLGSVLGRPTLVTAPKFGLSAVLGHELVAEMLLAGQRVLPKKLLDSGYSFGFSELEPTLRQLLQKAA